MSDVVVRIEKLGKRYHLGQTVDLSRTFRDTLATLPAFFGQKARGAFRRLTARPSVGTGALAGAAATGGAAVDPETPPGTFWALRDVDLEVKEGEAVGIVGRNGAGKSTLLKILSRITTPTKGEVTIRGRLASLLEVGTGFHPELTGRENIFLNGAILGMNRFEIARKFDEIVSFAEVERFIDTPVKRYSSGMHVRLGFAVAAHLEPEILVVDEVLAVGDMAFQRKCISKMGAVASQGRTVLFVSHNMESVRKLCTRGVLIEQGRVLFVGPSDEVVKRYVEEGVGVETEYEIPAPAGNPLACAYRLRVEDEEGNPARAVAEGKPWQVRVFFRVHRRTEHLVIALGMRTASEVGVRTAWGTPGMLEPGEYEAVFREKSLVLAGGRYWLSFGLTWGGRYIQRVQNAGVMEIAESAAAGDLIHVTGADIVLNPMDVSIRSLSQRSEDLAQE